MNLSEQEIESIVKEATENLKLQLSADLVRKLESQVTYEATNAVRGYVQEWVKENVLPEVGAVLVNGKASLVNTAASASEAMCEQLAEAMRATLEENLKQSWDRKKIFEAMFG